MSRFYQQIKNKAGNWIDWLGVNDLEAAKDHALYMQGEGEAVRVVERTDKVVWEPSSEPKK